MRGEKKKNIWIIAMVMSLFLTATLAFAQEEVPEPYAGQENPVPAMKSITSGKETFKEQCVFCHGENGDGAGPAGATLEPKPADFTNAEKMSQLTDTYLFWRLSEGGGFEPFNSAMPAKKGSLSEEEMWDVINYLRTFSLEKPESSQAPTDGEDGSEGEIEISKLGLELKAYTIGGIGIISTLILIVFAYFVIRKEGY